MPSGPTLPIRSLYDKSVNTALQVHTSTNLVAWTVCRKLLETAETSTEGRAGICAWKLRNACIVDGCVLFGEWILERNACEVGQIQHITAWQRAGSNSPLSSQRASICVRHIFYHQYNSPRHI